MNVWGDMIANHSESTINRLIYGSTNQIYQTIIQTIHSVELGHFVVFIFYIPKVQRYMINVLNSSSVSFVSTIFALLKSKSNINYYFVFVLP